MKSGVYKVENLLDGKVYIGGTENLQRRMVAHRNTLKRLSAAQKVRWAKRRQEAANGL